MLDYQIILKTEYKKAVEEFEKGPEEGWVCEEEKEDEQIRLDGYLEALETIAHRFGLRLCDIRD